MDKSNAHLFLPLVVAMAEGKTIQVNHSLREGGNWVDSDCVYFNSLPKYYRIKPEIETAWYRVAEYHWNGKEKRVALASTVEEEKSYSECKTFIRWLTERITYEVSK